MDQSTDDATEKVVLGLREKHAGAVRIEYHHLSKAGLSGAYNAGFRVAGTDIVACTDDDVIVHHDWLRAIERAFATDPGVGLVYGQVVIPQSLRYVGPDTIVPSLTWSERQRLSRDKRNYKVWGMGANMAARRTAFEDVGGFDELMGGGAPLRSSQDFDFALRAYRRGHAVLLEPDVKVDHYGARRTDQWPATEKAYGIGDGAFYGKHIRCRDLMAVRLLVTLFATIAVKSVYRTIRDRQAQPIRGLRGRGGHRPARGSTVRGRPGSPPLPRDGDGTFRGHGVQSGGRSLPLNPRGLHGRPRQRRGGSSRCRAQKT